jgi:hypothetical protein
MAFTNPFDMRRFGQILDPAPQSPLLKAYRGVSFGGTDLGDTSPSAAPTSQQAREVEDPVLSALSKLQTGRATDAYRAHLSQLPQAGDYAPSRARRLGAALTAAAASFGKTPQNAMALGEEIRDAPLRGALDSWKLKGAGLKEQADMEATDTKGQLERFKQILDYKDKMADNKRADDAAKVNETWRNAQIKDLEAGKWDKEFDEAGNLIYYNPKTGERRNLGPSSKTTEIGQKNTELGYRGQEVVNSGKRLDLERQRVGLEATRVGQEGTRIGIAQKQLGLNERNTKVNEANRGAGYISPQAADAAETLATRNIVTQNPQFKGWVNKDGMIRLPSEYSTGTMGWGAESIPDKNTPNYSTFLEMVEKEKQKILNNRRPGGVSPQMYSFDDLDK